MSFYLTTAGIFLLLLGILGLCRLRREVGAQRWSLLWRLPLDVGLMLMGVGIVAREFLGVAGYCGLEILALYLTLIGGFWSLLSILVQYRVLRLLGDEINRDD